MSYISPITIFDDPSPQDPIFKSIEKSIEDQQITTVWEYVRKIGIDVDKEELLRALKYDRGQYTHGHFDGYFEGYAKAKDEYSPDWIPTADRLPESPGFYLTTVLVEDITDEDDESKTRYGTIDISFFNSAGKWSDWDDEDVTAWMPLPGPYNKKEEDT